MDVPVALVDPQKRDLPIFSEFAFLVLTLSLLSTIQVVTQRPPPVIESGELFENDPERDKKIPRRRLARERVMQMLYAQRLNERDLDA